MLLILVSFAVVAAVLFFGGIIESSESSITPEIKPPALSHEGGFYDNEFDLEMSAGKNCRIFYTLDGSIPNETSEIYKGPIRVYDRSSNPNTYHAMTNVTLDYITEETSDLPPVDKCFIIRAVAVDASGVISKEVKASYFINKNEYRDKSVLSIIADPEDLFGDKGIYVTGDEYDLLYSMGISDQSVANFEKRGKYWEREANIEIFNGRKKVNQAVGIRVQGNGTRKSASKRFSLFAREEYGEKSFGYFSENEECLVTRDGFVHYIIQKLSEGRNVLTMNGEPVYIFLNGEMWSNQSWYLYEKLNESNLELKMGTEVAISKNVETTSNAKKGSNPIWYFKNFIENNSFIDDESYKELNKLTDIQSFIDSICISHYMALIDQREYWNNFLWHTVEKKDEDLCDSRWRWGLYDMDPLWGHLSEDFTVGHYYEINPFVMYGSFQEKETIKDRILYSKLRKNSQFCKSFVLTYMDMVNTVFSPENFLPVLAASGGAEWEIMEAEDFLTNRPEYAEKFVSDEFELTGTVENLNISINDSKAGSVRLNTIDNLDFIENSWNGSYFTDYPVSLTASAADGYSFSYWKIGNKTYTEKSIEADIVKGGTSIEAVFTKD